MIRKADTKVSPPVRQILIGTRNIKKREEILEILRELPVEFLGLERFPSLPEVLEDGHSFQENAIKKATTLARLSGLWVMAEDSGLEVDALRKEPGVFSARYAGEGATYEENNSKLLKALEGVPTPRRTATFRCAVALARPEGLIFAVEGSCKGLIAQEPRGRHGFGYDPVFYLPEYRKTFAELGPEIKNRLSHRTQALKRFKEKLLELF